MLLLARAARPYSRTTSLLFIYCQKCVRMRPEEVHCGALISVVGSRPLRTPEPFNSCFLCSGRLRLSPSRD